MSESAEPRAGSPVAEENAPNFLRDLVAADVASGKNGGRVVTRFPPEPNGYLHIGHAKSICLNFGLAAEFGGVTHLRMDDTNPASESLEYVESIQTDVRWLGFDWADKMFFASDYFEKLYACTAALIERGRAYVDSQTLEEIRQGRGDFYKPGRESPHRNRPVAESLDLFARMRAGEFADGAHVVRAKIDMASKNINLRDPVLYRILRHPHYRTGSAWCIYPMYDYAHALSDSFEAITHSICTLEFEDHRPLYDWCVEACEMPNRPQQIEFARLNLSFTVLSKRRLLELVQEKLVDGWDDPRMPTLSALRRRGLTPEAIRRFAERIGVSKRESVVDVSLLEHAVREDLNATSPRVMAVLRPLRVVLENFPENHVEEFDAPYFPEDPSKGSRKVPLSRVLYIEREDFAEVPPKKWFRLAPGAEIRLRYACLIKCVSVVKDPVSGEIVELRCTWDPASRGGNAPDGRKVKGTSHWVSAEHAASAEVRLYDRLFTRENPNDEAEGKDYRAYLNPSSLEVLRGCKVEPSLATAAPESRWQFERLGYFCVDTRDSSADKLVFNRTIGLKDTWAKIEARHGA